MLEFGGETKADRMRLPIVLWGNRALSFGAVRGRYRGLRHWLPPDIVEKRVLLAEEINRTLNATIVVSFATRHSSYLPFVPFCWLSDGVWRGT